MTKDLFNEDKDSKQSKVLCTVDELGVATVTLNNPDKHNAFDDDVIALLTTIFSNIADNPDIRVMVLTSTGKSFCAGADLGWMKRMADYSYQENLADSNALAQLFNVLNFMPQATIVQVQGAAFGGALGLVSCCDIVVAANKASFCLSEVKLGLIPATISPYVINAIGLKAARRYFLTAERFFADQAKSIGLVDEVVDINELENTTNAFVNTLLANGPMAVKAAKKLALDVAHQPIDDKLIADTSDRIASIRVSDEGQEGLTSFFEKRPTNWQSSDVKDN
ncbi:enoyl-CoA hydratase/isomerase family protein [uncultured Psychrosphaera sp.]|uniref:enoyl-CoA hydratase/isomerase family protein n=1 Tax=uncultured Psychrosphaera sp. TaxID=1403522 RepID=UPI0026388E99|nr:enoyl-CoA hydratase/isomerase family protein [uncultured Psychrosphaera sp.]